MTTSAIAFCPSSTARRLAAIAGGLSAAALIGFHAWLLWSRLVDGELFEPLVAVRWAASAGFVVSLMVLHRRGVALFRGRRALVVCLLVALLHVSATRAISAPASGFAGAEQTALALFLVPATAALSIGAGLVLLLGIVRRTRLALTAPRLFRVMAAALRCTDPPLGRPFSARPPPVPVH